MPALRNKECASEGDADLNSRIAGARWWLLTIRSKVDLMITLDSNAVVAARRLRDHGIARGS